MEAIMNLINTTAFPVVAFFSITYLYMKEQDRHDEETRMFTEAINELTKTLSEIKGAIGNAKGD